MTLGLPTQKLTIVSGGQTGVDRAALDTAVNLGLDYRGWCPRGGWAEDMKAPPGLLAKYPDLRETPATTPEQRTDWNVRDANALLVLVDAKGISVSKGTERAAARARACRKPCLVVDIEDRNALTSARDFLNACGDGAVCIAGPRESEAPGLYTSALRFLMRLFGAPSVNETDHLVRT